MLDHVLGVVRPPEHVARERQQRAVMALVQRLERRAASPRPAARASCRRHGACGFVGDQRGSAASASSILSNFPRSPCVSTPNGPTRHQRSTMRKLILGAALALVLPRRGRRGAEEPTAGRRSPQAACKTEKHDMGTKLFKKTLRREEHGEGDARRASRRPSRRRRRRRRTPRRPARPSATPTVTAFAEKYGTNKNEQERVRQVRLEHDAERPPRRRPRTASTPPRPARRPSATTRTRSRRSGARRRNAFGKCVSATAKADDE